MIKHKEKEKINEEEIAIKNDAVTSEILDVAVASLKKAKLSLKIENSSEGRTESAIKEKDVIDLILRDPDIQTVLGKYNMYMFEPEARNWFDVAIYNNDGTLFSPINIKISDLRYADNVSSFQGFGYTVTGQLPCKKNQLKENPDGICYNKYTEMYKQFDKTMDKNTTKDYYFLILNKNNTDDVFYTSLKTLNDITPNGSNLPFQCKWDKNRVRIKRTHLEARCMLMKAAMESLRMTAESVNLGIYVCKRWSKK